MRKTDIVSDNPALMEINTTVFLQQLRSDTKKKTTLGNIPQDLWNALSSKGFDFLWCMGVWERSAGSKASALADEGLCRDYETALPGWTEDDVIGSPYAVYSYRVDPRLGTSGDLETLKPRLNDAGLKLILDFVPNHLALDHPWTLSHPEYFIHAASGNVSAKADLFFETKNGDVLAHGKDPFFPAWKDTVQINYFSPDARKAMIDQLLEIARCADGLRCDMAMLVLNSVFAETWGWLLEGFTQPPEEFWAEAIFEVKKLYPSFVFIAEAYWDMEWQLQQLGFDYTYDKKLYDLLLHAPSTQIHDHLWAEASYQHKSVRFIENHDEQRASTAFGKEKSTAAAIIAATIPGLHFFHDGQMEGAAFRLPVQLARKRPEVMDRRLFRFYDRLLDYINHSLIRSGIWKLIDPAPAWENNQTYRNLLCWIWHEQDMIKLIVINYSEQNAQGRIYLPRTLAPNRVLVFRDALTDTSYEREPSNLLTHGLYVDLNPWQAHLFDLV